MLKSKKKKRKLGNIQRPKVDPSKVIIIEPLRIREDSTGEQAMAIQHDVIKKARTKKGN